MEKEAVTKGVPVAQALDIDIPPPRPKRKPSNPYPRKTGASSVTSQAGAKEDGKLSTSLPFPPSKVLDLEKEPLPEVSYCFIPFKSLVLHSMIYCLQLVRYPET